MTRTILEAVENVRPLSKRDALWLSDQIVDATIDALRRDSSITSRSFADWSLIFAGLRLASVSCSPSTSRGMSALTRCSQRSRRRMKFSEILEGYMEAQQKFLRERDAGRRYPANHEERNDKMINDQATNLPVINDDGFDQTDVNDRVIQGTILRCVDGAWSADGGDLPAGTKMLAVGTAQCLQRWEGQSAD